MARIVFENHYITLRELVSKLNLVYGRAQLSVIDIFGMRRVSARLALKDLSFIERHHRRTVAEDLISEAKK